MKDWKWIEENGMAQVDKKATKDQIFPQLVRFFQRLEMEQKAQGINAPQTSTLKDSSEAASRKNSGPLKTKLPSEDDLKSHESAINAFQKIFDLENENLIAGKVENKDITNIVY